MTDHLKKKTRNITRSVLPLILSLALLSCQPGIKERELSGLKTKNAELVRQSMLQQSKIHLQQTSIDSLKTVINSLEQQMAGSGHKVLSQGSDQQAIRQMVANMHVSWKELPERKDPQQILNYFLPNFMTNQINIDVDNKGHVASYTHEDYIQYLEEIVSRKKFSVEFGDVTYLDIEVKDREFFNVAYKCLLRSYKKDELTNTSSILVTVTGRKTDGEWKIANFSMVAFSYKDMG